MPFACSPVQMELLSPLLAQGDDAIAQSLGGLGAAPYYVLAVYLVVLLVLGVYGWIKSRAGEEDYYLAGRGQGWIVSSLTIMATFFSSFALLGAPGMVYREGVVFALFSLNVPVAGLTVYLLGARIWKLGRKFGYVTPGDMAADYYGSRYGLRMLVALTGFLYAIPYVVMQIQAGGLISQELFGPDSFTVGAILLALVTMLYIMIGGMRSVAWTDVIQGSLLVCGMLVSGFAMLLLFGGPGEFGRRVLTELPDSSLVSPGNTGAWKWTLVLTVCLFGSTGSMVQPAQWMRYYSVSGVHVLRRGAMIFALVLTSCFILGVMLIGLAGQVLYPLQFGYRVEMEQGPGALSEPIPADLSEHFRYISANPESADSQPAIAWTWQGKNRRTLSAAESARLAALSDNSQFQAAVASLSEQAASAEPKVWTHPAVDPKNGDSFDSILVVMLNQQLPRVLGSFGAIFASLLIVSIMAASMSTADSNLHALSAVLTRDIYDQFLRPGASETERVWAGRLIIVAATVLALAIVVLGHNEKIPARYDFFRMIATLGLLAIAFSAQLLPIAVDMLFLRKGTGSGAIAGLAAGLLGAFLFGDLFRLVIEGLGSPQVLVSFQQWLAGLKFTPLDGSVWGLALNVPVFVLVSLVTRPVAVEKKAAFAAVLR